MGKKNDDDKYRHLWEGKYASQEEWIGSPDYEEWVDAQTEAFNLLFPTPSNCRTQYELHCIYKTFLEPREIRTGCTESLHEPGSHRYEQSVHWLGNLELGYEWMKTCKSQVIELHDTIYKYLVKEYCIISYDWDDFEGKYVSEMRYEHFYPMHFIIVHSDANGVKLSEEGDFTDYVEAIKERDRLDKLTKDFLTVEVKDWYKDFPKYKFGKSKKGEKA